MRHRRWIWSGVLPGLLLGGMAWAADPPPPDAVPYAVKPGVAGGVPLSRQNAGVAGLSGVADRPDGNAPPPGSRPLAASGASAAARTGDIDAGNGVNGQLPALDPRPQKPPAPVGADGLGVAGLSVEPASVAGPAARVPTPSVAAASMPRPPRLTPEPTAAQQALINTGVASAVVRPGEANVFPVSAGRVNRIVTPFAHAKVSSEASGGIEVRGGVIYITPSGDAPQSMFVTEDGDESVAINLTLVPARMPPVHLELRLPPEFGGQMAARQGADRSRADAFERGHPFIDMVRGLMRTLALGQVPSGYAMQASIPATIRPPRCRASPVRLDFARGQYLLGSSVEVLVGIASNPGKVAVDFIESWCGDVGVLAVALSPTPFIPPGGASEIYVVRRVASDDADRTQPRPSLVNGGN